MPSNSKVNLTNLDDIEIYELLLQGRISNFPCGFWANRNEEEAKDDAKAKGKLLGRPKTTIADVPVSVVKAYDLLKNGKINKSECARMCDISRTCLYKYIRLIEEGK
jgi:hypothetical protein